MTLAMSCTGCQMASDRSRPGPKGLRSARSTRASAFTSAASTSATTIVTSTRPAGCSPLRRRVRRRRAGVRRGHVRRLGCRRVAEMSAAAGRTRAPRSSPKASDEDQNAEVDERGHAVGAEDVDDGEGAGEARRPGGPGRGWRSGPGRARRGGAARTGWPASSAMVARSRPVTSSSGWVPATMPPITSKAAPMDSARKKIHARQTTLKVSTHWRTAVSARREHRARVVGRPPLLHDALDDQVAAVDRAPHEERPRPRRATARRSPS